MKSKFVKLLCLAPFVFASLHAFEDDAKKNLYVQAEEEPSEDTPETANELFSDETTRLIVS